jgi:hypothetical protein
MIRGRWVGRVPGQKANNPIGVAMDMNFLLAILIWFGGNGTIAALIALLVDVMKRFGWIADGSAGKWANAMNLAGLVGFSIFFFLNPSVPFGAMDEQMRLVLQIVEIVLGYVLQLFVSPAVHVQGVAQKVVPFYSFPVRFSAHG